MILCLKNEQEVGILEGEKEILWSFVTHTGTAGASTGVLLHGTVDFPEVETQKISKEPFAMTCSVAKRQEKVP